MYHSAIWNYDWHALHFCRKVWTWHFISSWFATSVITIKNMNCDIHVVGNIGHSGISGNVRVEFKKCMFYFNFCIEFQKLGLTKHTSIYITLSRLLRQLFGSNIIGRAAVHTVNLIWAFGCAWLVLGVWRHDDVIKWKHFRVTGPWCGEFTGHRWIWWYTWWTWYISTSFQGLIGQYVMLYKLVNLNLIFT